MAQTPRIESLKLGKDSLPCMVMESPEAEDINVLAVPGSLPGFQEAYEKFEDLHPDHRKYLNLVKMANRNGMLLLLSEEREGQLFRLREERLLMAAGSEVELEERILPNLISSRWDLRHYATPSVHRRADDLASWCDAWSIKVGAAIKATVEDLRPFMYWLSLIRTVEGFYEDVPSILVIADQKDCVKLLERKFNLFHNEWNVLQGASLEAMVMMARRANQHEVLADCLRSLALLSQDRFDGDVFCEAFLDEELRARGWRKMLLDTQFVLNWEDWKIEPLEIDVDEVGAHGALQVFRELTEAVLDEARRREEATRKGDSMGSQMDLLGREEPVPMADEAPVWVLGDGIKLVSDHDRRLEAVRVVLLAECLKFQALAGKVFVRYPEVPLQCRIAEKQRVYSPLKPVDPGLN